MNIYTLSHIAPIHAFIGSQQWHGREAGGGGKPLLITSPFPCKSEGGACQGLAHEEAAVGGKGGAF